MGAHRDVSAGEAGFSLLEVVIALAVLLLVLGPVSSLVSTALTTSGNSRQEEVATDIASSELDTTVDTPVVSLLSKTGFTSLGTVNEGPVTYTAELDVQAGTACDAPQAGEPNELTLQVWVTWAKVSPSADWWGPSTATNKIVSESTYAPVPASALNSSDGSILLTVTDPSGAGIGDLTVTATLGNTTKTTTTSSLGCAFFANLAPGTWTISTSVPGDVDTGENSSSSESVAVTAGNSTTAQPIELSPPATVSSAYADSEVSGYSGWVTPSVCTSWSGSTCSSTSSLSSAMPLSFYNPSLTENNALGDATTPDPYAALAPASVFPFSTTPSYNVVSGDCGPDSDPDGSSTDGVAVNLTPGSSTTANFTIPGIEVVATLNGTAEDGAAITATPSTISGGTDSHCPTPSGGPAMPTTYLGQTSCSSSCVTSYETPPAGPTAGAVLVALDVHIPSASRGTQHWSARRAGLRRSGKGSQVHHAVLTYSGGSTTTSTTVSSSPTSPVYGQSVPFTATVEAGSQNVSNGTVTFTYGSTTLCSAVSLSNGTATCATSALPVGSDSVTATYSGSQGRNNYAGSSGTTTETVSQDSTNTTLSASPSSSLAGNPVTFTATVAPASPGAGTPTGTVTYEYGATVLCTETMSSGQVPSCTTSSLPTGVDTVTASYSGDGNFVASSGSFSEGVAAATYFLLSGIPYGTWELTCTYGSYSSTTSGTAVVVQVTQSGGQWQIAVYNNGNQVGSVITASNFGPVQVPL